MAGKKGNGTKAEKKDTRCTHDEISGSGPYCEQTKLRSRRA